MKIETPIRIELPTLFGMGTVNAWLFKTPVPTLIDCGEGTDDTHEALVAALRSAGLEITDLERVLITHAHVDHIGNLKRVFDESRAKIYTNPITYNWAWDTPNLLQKRFSFIIEVMAQYLGSKSDLIEMFKSYFQHLDMIWPAVPRDAVEIIHWDQEIALGGSQWKSIYTPGHCNHQGVYLDTANRRMISSDMLLKITPTPVVERSLDHDDEMAPNLSQMIASFELLESLDFDIAYPGHYEVIRNPKEIISKQLGRIRQRQIEILDYLGDSPLEFMSIYKKLYRDTANFPGIWMLIGYLDILKSEGKIVFSQSDNGLMICKK